MTLAATLALVAVVVLIVLGLDRRDALTLGVALALEDVIMLGNVVVLVALLVAVGVVWWRGRMERDRTRRIAEAAERTRVGQAKAAEADALAAARSKADADRARSPVDVLNDAMRRGGPLVLILSMLASPARALDCRTVPPLVVGQPLTEDQARCLSATVIADTLARETCEAQLVASRIETDACQATAQITCPDPAPPIVPVVVASLVGLVVGAVATVALLLAVPR